MSNEFDSITQLFQKRVPFTHPSTKIANGDDASVHQIPSDMELVISTDSAVSGIHWPEEMPLAIAGNRAVKAALSDLAAMGANATWIWLAVMAKDNESLKNMSDGIVDACLEHKVELAGGDTVRSATNTINVTVGGLVHESTAMTRSAAKDDDEVWIIGKPGLSALGLEQWFAGQQQGSCVSAFTHITPLLEKGSLLRELGIQCCMDVSDGLLQDAGHITKASQVSICLEVEKLTQLPSYQQLQAETDSNKALELTLNGGEDYALLFTAPSEKQQQLIKLGASPIGHCASGNSVKLLSHGSEIEFKTKGYDHFG